MTQTISRPLPDSFARSRSMPGGFFIRPKAGPLDRATIRRSICTTWSHVCFDRTWKEAIAFGASAS
jgi:hypothetical protein